LLELRRETQVEFEREANFMGSELLFQGGRFARIARDFKANAASIFHLASLHQASRHATAWRVVEVQDETIALAMYYPADKRRTSEAAFRYWSHVPSDAFQRRYPDMRFPGLLSLDHPWRSAAVLGGIASGDIQLDCGSDGSVRFAWESWWNNYALFVLLRRKPLLGRLVS
jgi:hypothetical protein